MGSRLFTLIILVPILVLSANWALGTESSLSKAGNKIFTIQNFRLENGGVLPKIDIAYETYGQLASDGRNGILITHGYTSDHRAAGPLANGGKGWWDSVIGPGKAIDTERYFIISSNMLGSCYGSTNPSSINPRTGKPYGPDFPEISMKDIVTAQQALVTHLGLKHLVAVVGPSLGGYQAFQWGVTFPDFMDGLVPVITAPKGSGGDKAVQDLIARLSTDPNWNDGWYYERGGINKVLTDMRVGTLKAYGIEAQLAKTIPDPKAREAAIRKVAEPWAKEFDGHSLVVLRRASVRFDAEKDFGKIRAKVLYVLSRTDKIFPPALAGPVMAKLKAANVDATYFEIDSENGHLASGSDAAKWSPTLRNFLNGLAISNH
jgi:homoserine O-acetyltransferase/O-succinyltransferase